MQFRLRTLLLNLALLCAALAVCVVILEVMLRLFGIGYPLWTHTDGVTGFSLRPGASGWQTDEGRAWVAINADGQRDIAHAVIKPSGTYRIAVLGDSYAEARQVPLEASFPKKLEQALASCDVLAGRTPEVINFGVSGFGTTQELLQLRDRVWKYQPDLVLLAFTTGNDVVNNSYALEKNADKPYFLPGDDGLTLDESFRERPVFQRQNSLSGRFALSALSHSRILQILNRVLHAPAPATQSGAIQGTESGIRSGIYLPPANEQWTEAWSITEELVRMMRNEVRSHDAVFVVTTLSNGIQVHPDLAIREAFRRQLNINTLFYPDQRIADLGSREGFPVLTLAPKLADAAQHDQTYLHGFANTILGEGHWNVDGHALAAALMADFVCTDVIGQ